MKQLIIFFISALILSACVKRLVAAGEADKKEYTDTIRYQEKLGLITVETKINGKTCNLIFDTGADLIVLKNDSLPSKSRISVKVEDSNENAGKSKIEKTGTLQIAALKYSNLFAVKMNFPAALSCLADGLLGNNLITRSHWKINSDYLIFSDKPFEAQEKSTSAGYFLYGSYRIFSNFKINGHQFDTCLVDYGGHFEIQCPMKYYNDFVSHAGSGGKTTKLISSQWGVNGKSKPDTSLLLNCAINFNGIAIENINVSFSEKYKERRIGISLLKRFNAVYIDHVQKKMFFELPLKPNMEQNRFPFSLDLQQDNFVVDGKHMDSPEVVSLNIGDELKEINGMKASGFTSYCGFFSWVQDLKKAKSVTIITKENKEIRITP